MLDFQNRLKQYLKPLDLSATLLIKYLSDFALVLKKASPFASILFILLNLELVLNNKKAIVALLLLLPALFITPTLEILRLIFSLAVLWIFLRKFIKPDSDFSTIIAVVVSIYSIIVFAGIFYPELYLRMGDDTFRYKFILESHNALAVVIFFSFTYLLNYYLFAKLHNKTRWLEILTFVGLLLLCVVLLFIKSRLYIALTFMLVLLIAVKNIKTVRSVVFIPIWYAVMFFSLSQISEYVISSDTTTLDRMATASASSDEQTTINLSPEVVDNKRLFNFSTTGRDKLIYTFIDLYKELGWKSFIYQNNTSEYLTKKARIPNINLKDSTLTENSYLIILLSTGFIGLLVFFYTLSHFAFYLWSQKAFLSFLYFGLILAVWFFEETVMYPLSMIVHLFALITIYRFEVKQYESSPSH